MVGFKFYDTPILKTQNNQIIYPGQYFYIVPKKTGDKTNIIKKMITLRDRYSFTVDYESFYYFRDIERLNEFKNKL